MAAAYRGLGKPAEAESCYVQAIELKPSSWWLYFELVHFYIGQGQIEKAEQRMDRVVALRPEGFGIWNNLGVLYYGLGRPNMAQDMWQRSLDIGPNYWAFSNLGALFQSQQEYRQAIPMYQKALEFNNRDYQVWMNLASSYYMVPEFQGVALDTYREAIRLAENQRALNPRDNLLLVQLADCYTIVGDTLTALSLVDEATAIPAQDANFCVTLGVIYIKLNNYDKAVPWLRRAAEWGYPIEVIESLPEVQKLMEHHDYNETLRLRAEEATKGT
jgi:tetratricopeptide (TPR) repeat protein